MCIHVDVSTSHYARHVALCFAFFHLPLWGDYQYHLSFVLCFFNLFLIFLFFLLFRASPVAYGSSQAWGLIGAAAASLRQIRSASVTYTTAHGNAGSLNSMSKARVEPTSSWILVRHIAQSHSRNSHYLYFVNEKSLQLTCWASLAGKWQGSGWNAGCVAPKSKP